MVPMRVLAALSLCRNRFAVGHASMVESHLLNQGYCVRLCAEMVKSNPLQ